MCCIHLIINKGLTKQRRDLTVTAIPYNNDDDDDNNNNNTSLLTPWSRVHLEKLTGVQLVKKFLHFMEPEGSLPHSQVPTTCPYSEPA